MRMKIKSEELAKEVALAVKDVFVANVEYADDKIEIVFLNGQKFVLAVEEV